MDDLTRGNLTWLLSDRPGRTTPAEWLANERSPDALEPFIRILGNENEYDELRLAAAAGLGRLVDAKAVDPLLEVIASDAPRALKEAAVAALGAIGPAAKDAVDPLVEILLDESGIKRHQLLDRSENRDHHADLRWRAAEALGRIGDPRAMGPLTHTALSAENPAIRNAAIGSLKFLGWRR